MAQIDIIIIALYFAAMIGTGFFLQKKASANIEAYFLGGRGIHWFPLAMSGSSNMYDITGTMWIVSMIYILGMKSMWIHWMWGWMMAAFFLAYMGKWVRRSNVVTGAEWMVTRFGDDRAGRTARLSYALMAIVTLAGFIGYAFEGIGKFASVYIPLSPSLCALIIIGSTTLYVLLGGLYSVVVTQVIQTVLMIIASIIVAYIGYIKVTPEMINASLPSDFTSLMPVWHIESLAGTVNAQYEFFGALIIVWVLKGLLLNAGGPAQMTDFQTLLAARNARDASKIGASWSGFLIVRWALCMGIAVLAMTGITTVTDPEQVMPIVLNTFLPVGIKGIVIAGLLAAFMSTFSSTVNSAASYVVRDIWQPYFNRNATQEELVRVSYYATVGIVVIGIAIGMGTKSIAQIWNWLMMALGAGVLIPNVLRWYWWRMNGWGYAFGILTGILLSLIVAFSPEMPMYIYFPPIVIASAIACIAGSYLSKPVDEKILVAFYRSVRPFGFWGKIRELSGISIADLAKPSEKASYSILNVILGMMAVTGFYLFPMYLVGHWLNYAMICFSVAAISCVIMYFTWYKNLSED